MEFYFDLFLDKKIILFLLEFKKKSVSDERIYRACFSFKRLKVVKNVVRKRM